MERHFGNLQANNHPTIKIILRRIAEESRPGKRNDDFIVGLCIEGGFLRGVVSSGMVVALEQLGLLNAFDRIYGSSSGVVVGAYFLAGQAAFGTTMNFENLNNRRFININRFFQRKPIVDMDFLVWEVMVHEKPLDIEAILSSEISLHVTASRIDSGECEVFPKPRDREELLRIIRAAVTLPFVAGLPYAVNGNLYLDAALTEPIPVPAAERDNCTHILALLTRPKGVLRPEATFMGKRFVLSMLRRESPKLARLFEKRVEQYARQIRHIDSLENQLSSGPHLLAIRPTGPLMKDLELNRSRLIDGASQGLKAVFDAFGLEARQVVEVLVGFDSEGRRIRLDRITEYYRLT